MSYKYRNGDKVLVRGTIKGTESLNGRNHGYSVEFADRLPPTPRVWIRSSEIVGLAIPDEPTKDAVSYVVDRDDHRWAPPLGKISCAWDQMDLDDDEVEGLSWEELWKHHGPLKAYKEVEL